MEEKFDFGENRLQRMIRPASPPPPMVAMSA